MLVLAIIHQRDAGPGVFAEVIDSHGLDLDSWLRPEEPQPPRDPRRYDAVLTFGGSMHADQEYRHPWLREEKELLQELVHRKVPLLGVCLGAQLLAEAAGAPARRASRPEIGWYDLELTPEAADDPLLAPLAPGFEAFQWHSYEFRLPPGATPLARSALCLQAFRLNDSAWGIQFHAEVTPGIVEDWIGDYRSDEDALRIGLDERQLREQTRVAIGNWNALGRGLCERFLAVAASHCGHPTRE
jgi:GMP synthase (glutamine-hydrolysing)